MTDTAWAELSITASKTFGMPFSIPALNAIVDALLEALRGTGGVAADGSDLLMGLALDAPTAREVTLRRFRLLATRAARETTYYRELFGRLRIDPDRLTWDDIARLPLTPKPVVRDRPYDFLARDARPVFRSTTTGTTGRPTCLLYSSYEIEVSTLLSTIGNLIIRDFLPEDIALSFFGSRATLGNLVNIGAMRRAGTLVMHSGQIEPEITLALLAEEHQFPGHAAKVSFTGGYTSYYGELLETGLPLGYRPSDFGLRRIDVGGDVTTQAFKRRIRELFGEIEIFEGWGSTEGWGMGGAVCSQGHLHYGTGSGLREFLSLDTGEPARPGELATTVLTPLPPYRDTTLLLRFNSEDVVRVLDREPECEARALPAVSAPQGRLSQCVRHDQGWTTPREVLEALESVAAVPLPARCGFWAVEGGIAVEVVARGDLARGRRAIADSLEAHGLPVRELHLHADRAALQRPLLWRGDLREQGFRAARVPVPAGA